MPLTGWRHFCLLLRSGACDRCLILNGPDPTERLDLIRHMADRDHHHVGHGVFGVCKEQ